MASSDSLYLYRSEKQSVLVKDQDRDEPSPGPSFLSLLQELFLQELSSLVPWPLKPRRPSS